MARWDNSIRKSQLPSDWQRRRIAVLERDRFSCTHIENDRRCGAYANQVDHVEPGDDHRTSNLTSLCEQHHAKKSAAEGHAAQRRRRRLPPEAHPGRIES